MRVDKTNQQTFGRKYTLKSAGFDFEDLYFFKKVLNFAEEKNVEAQLNPSAKGYLITTENDTLELSRKTANAEDIGDFVKDATLITKETIEELKNGMKKASSNNMLNIIKANKARRALKETLGLQIKENDIKSLSRYLKRMFSL